MPDLNTLLGCFGYYGQPEPPNACRACPAESLCRKVVARSRLNSPRTWRNKEGFRLQTSQR
jgi:hypothetical protein